jgi:hypothetical protein
MFLEINVYVTFFLLNIFLKIIKILRASTVTF